MSSATAVTDGTFQKDVLQSSEPVLVDSLLGLIRGFRVNDGRPLAQNARHYMESVKSLHLQHGAFQRCGATNLDPRNDHRRPIAQWCSELDVI